MSSHRKLEAIVSSLSSNRWSLTGERLSFPGVTVMERTVCSPSEDAMVISRCPSFFKAGLAL